MGNVHFRRLYLTDKRKDYIQHMFKIPVDCSHPGTDWIVCLDRESTMPTPEELAQLKSYCEFVVSGFYSETYQRKILEEKPLPAEGGHVTTIFRKGRPHTNEDSNSWFYRKATWEIGPTFIPNWIEKEYKPLNLLELMDYIHRTHSQKAWSEWKGNHQNLFS